MNLSTDGQRPGERTMLILGLRFPAVPDPVSAPQRQSVPVDVGVEPKNASRMPPDQRSDMGTTVSTTRKSSELSGDVQPLGYGLTTVERRPKMRYRSLTRTAAVAVGMWKSRALVFGAISKRGGKRGKVRGASFSLRLAVDGLFRAFHGASFPQRHSHRPSPVRGFRGSAARDGGGSGCRYGGKPRNLFPKEVTS